MASFMGSVLTVFLALVVVNSSATEFQVGDEFGWQQPGSNNSAVYSNWASNNRFHVGDSLFFKYKNDSVLEVDKWGYYHCNTSHPIIAFDNGKSIMKLDRSGPFYFISGVPDHCKNGQLLLVEVMEPHPISQSPQSIADSPEPHLAADSPASSPSLGVVISITPCSLVIALLVTSLALVCSAP
ncbi:early nodulin-like protein 7 [Rosa rugosa]|uniref:early nodulin-like protein 7 n=1 Tax=Rosa rugosa TaxID=74645 RepID=UPI002B416755|nr:early nodulin-like protein 7 [Rosa rugosa]